MGEIQELIERYCPDGVEYKKLGDVCLKTKNIKWSVASNDTYQYIDLSSVDMETGVIGDTTEIGRSSAPSRAQQLVQTDDVLFATTRPTQLRVCIVPAEYDGQICSTGFCVLRAKKSIVNSRFMAYCLGGDGFLKFLENNQTQGNYPSIPNGKLKEFEIPVPPLEVQQAIVDALDSFVGLE